MLRKMVSLLNSVPVKQEAIVRGFSIFKQNKIESDLAVVVEKAAYDIDEANRFAKSNVLSRITAVEANFICNRLLAEDASFREKCQEMVSKQMAKTTPSIRWRPFSEQGVLVPAFRSLVPRSDYGLPEYIFKHGMPAAIFNMRNAKQPLSEARINSYIAFPQANGDVEVRLSIANRHDMLGFTFGPLIAMSLNIAHCADQRYTSQAMRFQADNYIYLFALDSGYSSAEAIHHGSGYVRDREKGLLGEKGVSCTEDAREISPGVYVPANRILGCRLVNVNGELGSFIPNPNVALDELVEMARFIDVRIFLEANSVQDIKLLEAGIYPEVRYHPNAIQRINELHALNKELKRQIQNEAIASRHGTPVVSNLLRAQHSDISSGFCKHSFRIFSMSQQLAADKNSGSVLDGKEHYDNRKARSEDELIDNAINLHRSTK